MELQRPHRGAPVLALTSASEEGGPGLAAMLPPACFPCKMPFALLIIGLTLITVAVRNTQEEFIGLVYGDFTGPGNFFWWVVALVMVGSIGYVQKLKGLSDALLILILLALVLSRGDPKKGDFFGKFLGAIKSTQLGSALASSASVSTGPGDMRRPPIRVNIGDTEAKF